jgi:hypothetical protein
MIAMGGRQRDKEKNGKINVGIGATRERKWFINGDECKETVAREHGEVKQSGNNIIDRPRTLADLVFLYTWSKPFISRAAFTTTCGDNMKCDLSH